MFSRYSSWIVQFQFPILKSFLWPSLFQKHTRSHFSFLKCVLCHIVLLQITAIATFENECLEVWSSKSISIISTQIWIFKNDLWSNLYFWLISHKVSTQNHQNQREILHYLVRKYFGSVTHSGQDFIFLLSHFIFLAEDLADSSKIDKKLSTIQFSNVKSDLKWWS